ncbi:HvfC/BufC N-terminal domain-containing protein [Halomonas caseinilytica]|uniref:HvfC/BufC N-terminal domain-containing protein n=1 Tax=Halomonas caseinilytica TaxID=438744 RepID=UPI0007E53503|nr:DNA-binding domain-containing protein [Halomonas caseinilytica]SEM05780.1 Putative DNA-binding domain-containing protein [Halomonas caseinilytica]
MTISLADWQHRFAEALHAPDATDPDLGPQPGLDVYRNNVRKSLIEALSSTFPHTRTLLGERFFTAVASDYVRRHLPDEPRLVHYGNHFADMLDSLPTLADYPYVIDICRLERARLDVSHAADATPLDAEALARSPDPGALACSPCPATRHLIGCHDVLGLWRALERGEARAGVGAPGRWHWLLVRRGRNVDIQSVTPACGALYHALATRVTLGDALTDCGRRHDPEEAGEALGTLLGLGALTLSRHEEVTP